MNPQSRNPVIGLLLLAGVLASQSSQAQSTDTWVGGTATTGLFDINTTANWTYSAGSGPVATGDSLVFAGSGATAVTNNEVGFNFAAITYNSGAPTYTLVGNSFTLGTTTSGTAITVNSASAQLISTPMVLAAAAQTISLPSGNLTLSGAISGAGGGITLAGVGTLTLTNAAAETFTGPVVVNGGTLVLFGPNAGSSGIYQSSGLTINNGGTFMVGSDNALAGSTSTLGDAPVTVNAGGILTSLSTADAGAGASTHIRGVLTLNGGTLANGGTGVQAAYGTWDLDDGVVVNGGTTASTISALDVVPDQAGGTYFKVANGGTVGGIDLNITGTLINGTSTHDTGIIKTNAGTLALSGVNTYMGATTIAGGTLEVNGAGELGSGTYAGAIINNGVFIYNSSQSQTLSGVISGTGTLTQAGSGTLTLSGVDTFTGATTISAGALTISGSGQLGAGVYAAAINNSGALTFNSSAPQTLSSVISGGGTLTLSGSGALTLATSGSAANTAVQVTPGAGNTSTLGISSAGTSSQWNCSSLTFNSGGAGAVLQFNFTGTPSTSIAPLNVTGNLTFNATPIVAISGVNIASGNYPLVVVGGSAPTSVPTLNQRGFTGSSSLAWGGAGFSANTLVLTVSGSFSAIVDPLSWSASGSGTWDINNLANNVWKDGSATPKATYYQQVAGTPGDAVLFGDKYISGNTTVTLNTTVTPAKVAATNFNNNYTIAGTGTIAGNGGLAKAGAAGLTIGTTNSFTGGVAASGGTLTLDFTASGAPPTNILNLTNALTLGGATLTINGNASTPSSQTFSGTTFAAGGNLINLVNNGASPTLNLGALTYPAYATVEYNTNGAGTITTTSLGTGPLGILWGNYATFGTGDWASTDTTAGTAGSGAATIRGLSSVTGGYTTTMGGTGQGINLDLQANFAAGANNVGATTIRFNTPTATTVNVNGKWAIINAVLVTTNMGPNNCSIGNGNWYPNYSHNPNTEWVVQNNPLAYFTIGSLINDSDGGSGAVTYVQSGVGTVVMPGTSAVFGTAGNSANNYTGASYLNGGCTVVAVDADLGTPATAAPVYLNGGTVVGNAIVALDSGGGANPRPITLVNNGGGLAATAGNTLTVDGQIGSLANAGPLVIGIPPSSANGYVSGLLPGTGTGTANPTALYGTGTVILNYPNGANGNFFYGGVTILGGATLNINSQFALGGANYGGLTFNNGTLQYNATLPTGAAGTALDISGAAVTLAGNATIDVNGHTIAYANAIGNGGSGGLTVTNSGTAGAGALLLNGGSSFKGGTLVASGAVFGGTGAIAGNVIWAGGSYAALTQGSPLEISGSVSLTNPTVQVTATGLTTGTYTLLTAAGGITSGSTVNPQPIGTGIVANGFGGTVSISGSSIILTVIQLGVATTWTDALSDQNWSEGGNWTGGFAPMNPGDAATFGSGGVGAPVNLNQNETVGALAFNNASSYTITGSKTLTLDNKGNGVAIAVTAGTANAINTSVSLNGNVNVSVNAGDSLAFGGTVANKINAETLTLTGGGTVALSAANNYGPAASGSVGTALNGVTVQVGNNTALGSGDVNVTGNSTLQAGAAGLTLANNLAVASTHTISLGGNNLTLNGVISGNGSLAANSGTVALGGGNNTYTGDTILNGGILSIASEGSAPANPASLGVVPAAVTPNDIVFNGGDLLATATLTLQANRGLAIGSSIFANTNTATAFIDAAAGQSFTIAGTIASAGNSGMNNLTVNASGSTGMVILSGTNTFNGTNAINAGTEQLASSLALQNSTLNYNNQGGVLDFGTLTAVTLNGLTGSENLTLENDSSAAVTLTIANNNNGPLVYTGLLGDGGTGASLIISGSGSQQIGVGHSGGAVYGGATTFYEGSLILGGNTSLSGALTMSAVNGPCNLTLQDAAAFAVNGPIDLASSGGNTYPGVCTITLLGNATMSASAFNFGTGASRIPSCMLTIAGNASLNLSGGLELEDSEGGTPENNVVNLNGGTLATTGFTLTDGAVGVHQATLNFNGGVLAANASDASPSTFLPAFPALTVNVLTNGALINPNGYSITLTAVLTGAGGLTNLGTSGTLSLAGANTYGGATFITNGGTLNVINTTGSATGTNAVTLAAGATLEGTGAIAGNVIWQPGAQATLNAGFTPTPLTVGTVTLNNNLVTVNVAGGTPLTVGSYVLMHYTATGSTGVFNSTPVFTGAGVNGNAVITTANGVVTLTVSPSVANDVWDVDANGNWTDASKWSSNPTVPGKPGDEATLGVGSTLRTVTLNANESLGFLALSNANSFVVGNAGHILTLDNNGNGAYVTVSGGAANQIQTAIALNDNATLTVDNGSVLSITGGVANSPGASQPETLTINGVGTVILTNNNSYGPAAGSIGTTLNGATLQVGNNGSLGAGDVNVAGNSVLQSGAAGLILTNNLDLTSGMTVTLNDNGNQFTLGGLLNGGGAVTKVGSGTLTLTNGNSFSGGLTVSNGTVVLSNAGSGGNGTVTNAATLQLANASAVSGALTMNSGSTLQLRADSASTFSPGGLTPQNASDTLNFDVGPVTSGVAGNLLTLSGSLAFTDSQVNQTINVTGTNGYALALGDISAISGSTHQPYQMVDLNVLPNISLQIASFTSGNWGDFLNFTGGGNTTVLGNLGNTSDGSIILLVNGGSQVTLQGSSLKSGTGDGYRYLLQNGELVADNSAALINNTTGAGLNTSYFILGPATNLVIAGTSTFPTGFQTVNTNNRVNCAFYLGDANNLTGGLTLAANVTNNVSDGDAGFTNNGVMTLGGQNTSGVNTFANNIILGWTPNRGKSVALVAATGGEVDFTGSILANGADTTAGITVGNAGFGGLVKLGATNTYAGPTLINAGTLALANLNGYDANIGSSAEIAINRGAILDVTGQSSGTLPLGTGGIAQTLQGAGTLNGILTVGALGTVAPGTNNATGILTISTSATLGGAAVMKLNNAGSPTSDELSCPALTAGGILVVTNVGPALAVGNTFKLFSAPVHGFTSVSLPAGDNNHKYTWNNQLAANGTIVVATAVLAVNTNAATANFHAVNVGSTLQFSWAADHTGWQLYTNAVGVAAANSWFPIPGSASANNVTIPINPANPNVYFQLRYP